MPLQFELPEQSRLRPNNERDPLPYYYKPGIGWLYRHRLQMGLDLLPDGGARILEIGVGSGILVPTLTAAFSEYTGSDLVLAPNLDRLVDPRCRSTRFIHSDLLDVDALPEGSFDCIVCFSVLEHVPSPDRAARALARALASSGTLVTGYPMVNPTMTRAFEMIGYSGIDEDHITAPAAIHAALGTVLRLQARKAFPPMAPVGAALYQCTAWAHGR